MTEHPEPPDLGHLIEQLTAEHPVEVRDADRVNTIRQAPPLLADLADARTSSVGYGRGGKAVHERLSLNVDASELLSAIEHRVRRWAARAGIRPTGHRWPPVDVLLRQWWDTVADDPHLHADRYAAKLAGWAEAITDLIDPPFRYTLDGPCPLCGVAYVNTAEDAGRALQVIERDPPDRSVVTCRSCEHVWRGIAGARDLAAKLRPEDRTA